MAFNAQKNIEYIDKQLAYFMYMLGLNPNSIESITIDQILDAARAFAKVQKGQTATINNVAPNMSNLTNEIYSGNPYYSFLKNQRIFLILNIRRLWYWRQLALGALNRES